MAPHLTFTHRHPMWVIDTKQHRFVTVTPEAEALFGCSRERLLSMSIFDILAPEERERLRNELPTRPVHGDGGVWTGLLPSGERFQFHTKFRYLDKERTRQFTAAVQVWGRPDMVALDTQHRTRIRGILREGDIRVGGHFPFLAERMDCVKFSVPVPMLPA